MIATGDYPSTIARKYKVKFEDLLAINGWTLQGQIVPEFPAVGTTIKIPPGWTEPGTADRHRYGDTGTPTETTTTVAGGQSDMCARRVHDRRGRHLEGKVAKKLDTTVDALDAANANTAGYSGFYPGLKIKTPPKADC